MIALLCLALLIWLAARSIQRRQGIKLPDGTTLTLNRVSVGTSNDLVYGSFLEKLLGNLIPSNGWKFSSINLNRPIHLQSSCPPGKTVLVAEFKFTGATASNNPLVNPVFDRQFRCVIHGDAGIDFVQEFTPLKFFSPNAGFTKLPGGYYGLVQAERFPRDSRHLWFRIESRPKPNQYGPWTTVAEFKINNPAPATVQPWKSEPVNASKHVGDLDFSLGQITVDVKPFNTNDIWENVVATPFLVQNHATILTNWEPRFIKAADASGNWDYLLGSHRTLDPRFVWKLEVDFEPASNFPPQDLVTVKLPKPNASLTTNLQNEPVTLSWDGNWIDAEMPTNNPNLAIRVVGVTDDQGRVGTRPAGSWGQFHFREGDFLVLESNGFNANYHPTHVTFAVVTNIHLTFYAQPILVTNSP